MGTAHKLPLGETGKGEEEQHETGPPSGLPGVVVVVVVMVVGWHVCCTEALYEGGPWPEPTGARVTPETMLWPVGGSVAWMSVLSCVVVWLGGLWKKRGRGGRGLGRLVCEVHQGT